MRFDFAASRKEIAQRNALRLVAGLLSLNVAEELRRMFQAHQFKRWLAINSDLRQRIEAKYLERVRRLRNDDDWRPTGMLSGGGLAFYNHMRKVMHRIWIAQRRQRS
jgi:hypothetical protein